MRPTLNPKLCPTLKPGLRPNLGPLAPALRRRRRSRGQSLVEFALILPVFLVLFGAVLDLGRIAAARVAVTNAAREGAFQASVTPTSFQAGQPCSTTTNLVMCRTLLEAKSGSVVAIAPADVQLTCSPTCSSGMGNTVTVTVTGHFNLLTPLMTVFFGGSQDVTFAASSTHQIETLPPPPTPTPAPTPTSTPTPTLTPTPTPTPTPTCGLPSAGFTYSTTPANMKAPVTLTVTDTSTSPGCPITAWLWDFGDGTTSIQQDPGTKTYVVAGTYNVTLQVTNQTGSNTTGVVAITVK